MSKIQTMLIIIALLLISNLKLQSQVTIGSGEDANQGALLDIKEKNVPGANSTRGLILPLVSLQSLTILAPEGADFTGDIQHIGLTVFNLKKEGNQLCKGVYIWTGITWVRLGKKCFCEYTIIGKHDNREYHIFCDDFSNISSEDAKQKCSDPSIVGGEYNYHLMTANEYHQIWSQPVKGTATHKFLVGDTYMVHKNSDVISPSEGWITLGFHTFDNAYKENKIVGWSRGGVLSPTYPIYFPGGPSIGGTIKESGIVRCVRD